MFFCWFGTQLSQFELSRRYVLFWTGIRLSPKCSLLFFFLIFSGVTLTFLSSSSSDYFRCCCLPSLQTTSSSLSFTEKVGANPAVIPDLYKALDRTRRISFIWHSKLRLHQYYYVFVWKSFFRSGSMGLRLICFSLKTQSYVRMEPQCPRFFLPPVFPHFILTYSSFCVFILPGDDKGSCFSFLRFIDVSPAEMCNLMLQGTLARWALSFHLQTFYTDYCPPGLEGLHSVLLVQKERLK